jgi:hypothetical protein
MTWIGVCSWHWPCSPGLPHPIPLSLFKLPFPSSRIWDTLLEPLILENTLTAHREFHPLQCASNRHPPPVNPPSRSSLGESSSHAELWSLSHFLKILALGLSSLLSLGTGSPRTVGPCDGDVLPGSSTSTLSWGTNISGKPIISSAQFRPHYGDWTIPNSFRLPTEMSPGQPWASSPNAWS